ncbi:transposase, partial [Nocardia vinacea]|uniref:transposase n=1 Tax=Nocardia vinacea TaxID=96468 RepID=UPI003F4D6AFD
DGLAMLARLHGLELGKALDAAAQLLATVLGQDADILPTEAEAETGARVFGDAAYGAGELLKWSDDNRIHNGLKVQPAPSVKGHFSKDRFQVDLDRGTVTCPAGNTAPIHARHSKRHIIGTATFGAACGDCPLRAQCTSAADGRRIAIGPHEKYPADPGDLGVAAVARRDIGGGDDLAVGVDRDVSLIAIEPPGLGLAPVMILAMARTRGRSDGRANRRACSIGLVVCVGTDR